MKAPAKPDGPTIRQLFYAIYARMGELLEPNGFTIEQEGMPALERAHKDWIEIVGLTYAPSKGAAEFRMTYSIESRPLMDWRQARKKKDARLPLGPGGTVAAVDFRRLAPKHPLFDRTFKDRREAASITDQAVNLVRSHGFPYGALFEDPERLAANLEEKDLAGLHSENAIEFLLFRDRIDLAQRIHRAFVRRLTPEGPYEEAVNTLRRGEPLPESIPYIPRMLALTAVLYDL
jgi:hypothetical protein